MRRSHIRFAGRWRAAVPVFAVIAAMATAAPAAGQAAVAPQSGGGATVHATSARLAVALPPPMPGYTPATAIGIDIFETYYTGTDHRVYEKMGAGLVLGGRLIGGPGAADGEIVFGRGTDNALWQAFGPSNAGPSRWRSLGGRLTSRPGVAPSAGAVTNGQSLDVVVRGADGAVWDRRCIFRQSGLAVRPWRSLGGRVLAGSGPAAVKVGGTLYVLAVGTDQAVWVKKTTDGTHWSSWRRLGARVKGDLGAASPVRGVGIVFARGTDNAAWYNQFAGKTAGITPGWHSLGGRLTSGVGAAGSIGGIAGSPPTDNISVVAMGTDNRIMTRGGIWPKLRPWGH